MFPTLIAKGLSQEFVTGKPCLSGIDLVVDPGQIHVVVGHSGAGKSAIANILGGVTRPTSGSLHLQGQLVALKSEQDALAKGIRYVRQSLEAQSRSAVADALRLEAVPRRFGLVDTHALYERAKGQLAMYGMADIDPKTHFADLSPGRQKQVELAACLSKAASLLILDDPTAYLNDSETEVLYQRLSQLQYANTGIIYFTPRAEEALQVGDRISVLRDGELIATHDPSTVFVHQIAGEMIGRDLSHDPVRPTRIFGPEVALRVEGLSIDKRVYAVGIKAKRGEIVGIVGLQGAGQFELLRAIGGVEPRTDGEIFLKAAALPSKIRTRDEALASGIGIISEPWGRVADVHERDSLTLPGRPLRSMNAENPQKGPIAKCLQRNCSVLLFDHPTRGLNIACRLELFKAIPEIADLGVTILAASTDVEELMSFCDRIAIMADGRIVRYFERPAFNEEKMHALVKGRT